MTPTAVNLIVSTLTIAVGLLFSAAPEQAARLWGRRELAQMADGATYRRLYRFVGVLLCLGGLLFAAESLWSI